MKGLGFQHGLEATLKFGLFLSEEEKIWLVEEIRAFLEATN